MTSIDDCSPIFEFASLLTDPICMAHENLRRIEVVDALNPWDCKLVNFVRKIFLWLVVLGYAFLAAFTTLPGIALRGVAAHWQKEPFICEKSAFAKQLPKDRTFTLLSWNCCCVAGGYTITDGGVVPWRDRIDAIIDRIAEQGADVNCLYETFDTKSAFLIAEKLKERGYGHIYYDIGPRAIGVSSGILIASKFEIQNPEFTLFPQDTLVGRTKNAAKGVFGFDLVSDGESFARIFSTHLQHSEEPQFPTQEEIEGRKRQMEMISSKVGQVKDRCVIVTGDLNMDDNELSSFSWPVHLDQGPPIEGKTWGGDELCARLTGKRISGALNLDHTLGSAKQLVTVLGETGYDPTRIDPRVLSDHRPLISWVQL
ncbi:MAG TPA: endonuclease/exonuclease/phosphatase family protein [Chlamydiales bacterium]|nr:endonuclease/exonuclease/phosphatase family protein [Chlamydiales bacterium]